MQEIVCANFIGRIDLSYDEDPLEELEPNKIEATIEIESDRETDDITFTLEKSDKSKLEKMLKKAIEEMNKEFAEQSFDEVDDFILSIKKSTYTKLELDENS